MLGAAVHLQLTFPVSSAGLCAPCIFTYFLMAYSRDSLALLLWSQSGNVRSPIEQ